MKKRLIFLCLGIILLLVGNLLTASSIFIGNQEQEEEAPPQAEVEVTLKAVPDPKYLKQKSNDSITLFLKQNATVTLSITNHNVTSIEHINFHQELPEDLGFVDALGGANFTTKTINYTWKDPVTSKPLTLGTNETLEFWYIVNGTNEGTFTLSGTISYRLIGEHLTKTIVPNPVKVHVRKLAPGNLQAFQVIISGASTITLGENATIELILRNFHNFSLYNVSYVQKFPKEGITLLNASGGVIEKTVKENVTEKFINYTWSTPFAINETVRFQYIVNSSMNGTFTIPNGTITYSIHVETEPRTVEINSLVIEVNPPPSILPRPPKGTRELHQLLIMAIIVVPTTFFVLAAVLTRGKPLQRPKKKKKRRKP
ncbi:MAG: hypothetical protein ACE5R6_10350 [Candidatus Heimdallarchaeota archaeon]